MLYSLPPLPWAFSVQYIQDIAAVLCTYTSSALHAIVLSPYPVMRSVLVCSLNETVLANERSFMQALFNYFSCSAVAIATQVGGANAALVTLLMIAAHMVRPLYCLAVITANYLTICCLIPVTLHVDSTSCCCIYTVRRPYLQCILPVKQATCIRRKHK